MTNQKSSNALDGGLGEISDRVSVIEGPHGVAFIAGGALVLTSLLAPLGFRQVTDRYWLWPLAIVGIAVLSVAIGLLGVYSSAGNRSAPLAIVGVCSAVVAGVAASTLAVSSVAALVLDWGFEETLSLPQEVFLAIAFLMAGGIAVGFLSFGLTSRSVPGVPSPASNLLLVGGAVLLVPVFGEVFRWGFGIGPPAWLVLPVLVLNALSTIAVGVTLRRRGGAPR